MQSHHFWVIFVVSAQPDFFSHFVKDSFDPQRSRHVFGVFFFFWVWLRYIAKWQVFFLLRDCLPLVLHILPATRNRGSKTLVYIIQIVQIDYDRHPLTNISLYLIMQLIGTLLGTNISPFKGPFHRWQMSVAWKCTFCANASCHALVPYFWGGNTWIFMSLG